jgi:hypothetical protein
VVRKESRRDELGTDIDPLRIEEGLVTLAVSLLGDWYINMLVESSVETISIYWSHLSAAE